MANTISSQYSGVVLNQNVPPESANDYIDPSAGAMQFFRLPDDYQRDGTTPPLTGIQLLVGASDLSASMTVVLEHKPFFSTWTTLAQGTLKVAVADDEIWGTCLFDSPVSVTGLEADLFRFRVLSPTALSKLWYSVPNPLAAQGGVKAANVAGTALSDGGREYSFMFRVLGAVADSGTDFLGNAYRSAVVVNAVDNAQVSSPADVAWMSGPQPSKFAVVAQYFEMQDGSQNPVVVDRMYLDPLTPGMWCHVYYCNDGDAGTTDEEWEERLWIPVGRPYKLLRADSYAFPDPIHARFIKIEYSHLQAKSYSPGSFQKPIAYKKHPQWVLDYFLLAAQTDTQFVARSVQVNADAYNLAYTYYSDDLMTSPDGPPTMTPEDQVKTFLADDLSNVVDAATRSQITTSLRPFLQDQRTATVARTLLGDAITQDTSTVTYPVESLPTQTVPTAVSSLDRESVLFEDSFPVMHFYLTCRHRYREVSASLAHDRAYFAGVRQVSFTREQYASESDLAMYVETLGDYANVERNDFLPPPAYVNGPQVTSGYTPVNISGSTSVRLGANAKFSQWFDLQSAQTLFTAAASSNVAGTLSIETASGTTLPFPGVSGTALLTQAATLSGSTYTAAALVTGHRFVRLVYTNGATAQTSFTMTWTGA